jgi:hypothetical protein
MDNKDFTVYLHERYGMTKDEFCKVMLMSAGKTLCYEETSYANRLPMVDYDKLWVGARIYVDANDISCGGCNFKEAVVTHLYGGVMFYKFIDDETEYHMSKESFSFMRTVYPKVVVKPDFFEMVCDCDKTTFVNYGD